MISAHIILCCIVFKLLEHGRAGATALTLKRGAAHPMHT